MQPSYARLEHVLLVVDRHDDVDERRRGRHRLVDAIDGRAAMKVGLKQHAVAIHGWDLRDRSCDLAVTKLRDRRERGLVSHGMPAVAAAMWATVLSLDPTPGRVSNVVATQHPGGDDRVRNSGIQDRLSGGSGIRTHGGLPHTRFPSVPIRPLSHPSWLPAPSRGSSRSGYPDSWPALACGGRVLCNRSP